MIPAPLIAIVLLTVAVVVSGWKLPNVSDQGELPRSPAGAVHPERAPERSKRCRSSLPTPSRWPIVGIMESLMTAKLVDDITDTHSNKTRESWGQGIANIALRLLRRHGRLRHDRPDDDQREAVRGPHPDLHLPRRVFLLILVLALGDIVGLIPMAALVAVMIMVSVATFDWHSIRPTTLRLMPWSETAVMLVTVIATVATHNLAIGVVLGVITAMILFARRVAHLVHIEKVWETDVDGDGTIDIRRYAVKGELFWASSNDLVYQFDYAGDPDDRHHRPHRRRHLGRLHRRRPRRRAEQVRRPRQGSTHHRPGRRQPPTPGTPFRQTRRRTLSTSPPPDAHPTPASGAASQRSHSRGRGAGTKMGYPSRTVTEQSFTVLNRACFSIFATEPSHWVYPTCPTLSSTAEASRPG